MNKIDYRSSHLNKGIEYHQKFYRDVFRTSMWDLEKEALINILNEYKSSFNEISMLDFACGTGRIVSFLEDKVKRIDGVDVSNKMLEVARKNTKKANLYLGDITLNSELVPGPYDVITAFRFFPNAEYELKTSVIKCLHERLSDDGILIFNNHRNYSSITYRLLRILRNKTGAEGWNDEEVKEFITRNDFQVVKRIPFGFIPAKDRYMFLPRFIWKRLERYFSKFETQFRLAQNVIYVCVKV